MRQILFIVTFLSFVMVLSDSHAAMSQGNKRPGITGELAEASKLIDMNQYETAVRRLRDIIIRDKKNANAYNLLGYAYRKMNRMDDAATNYDKALTINPSHKGALEYQGEMFLTIGEPDKAEANVARLNDLCPQGCDELQSLETAVAAYRKR